MADPIWLNHERIDFIHEQAIDMAGGSRGLRDPGLLDSELARPKNLHAYGEQDIFQLDTRKNPRAFGGFVIH